MSDRHTSRVFEAGLKLYERVLEAQIPQHPTTGKVPPVVFGDEDPDKGAEKICIMLDVEPTTNEWVRLGAGGRDEPMVFNVVIRSWVPIPNQTTRDVWLRLAAISGAVEDVLYDTTGRRVLPLGFAGETPVGRSSGVKPTVFPTEQGPFGGALITVALEASI